jgi:hypothetical protein
MLKKGMVLLTALGLLLGGLSGDLRATELTGRDIMIKVDERDDGETRECQMKLTLINKAGDKRIREVISYQKDYGKDTKSLMVFKRPADVKGTGYLSWEYDNENQADQRWLYLPALRKTKKITGSSSDDYFMGTDFTYDDMGDRNVDEDTHTLLREEKLNGRKCWVIKSIPKEKDNDYKAKTLWIAQDLNMMVKVEYFNAYGLLKILKLTDIVQIDGIWTARKMVMDNKQKKHKTILEYVDTKYNLPLKDNFFRTSILERGNIRY